MATLETVLNQALKLSTLDKVRLIERVTPEIEQEITVFQGQATRSYPSLWGLCRDAGPAPSAADIDQVREEFLVDFPREDIA